MTLRPALQETRAEARLEWDAFIRAMNERNDLLPGLVEAVKGFEPGHGRLAERSLAARSIAMRAGDPDNIVASVDDIERSLTQIGRLVHAQPDLGRYTPFAGPWEEVRMISRRVAEKRSAYNKTARLYNRLLTPFPPKHVDHRVWLCPRLGVYPDARPIEGAEAPTVRHEAPVSR